MEWLYEVVGREMSNDEIRMTNEARMAKNALAEAQSRFQAAIRRHSDFDLRRSAATFSRV
jgi:hypothetical protein